MNVHKFLRVSIVIPVYNEADRIGACLEAIAAQTVRPYEVIVVDNNSDDDTAAIASRFDFVSVISEPRQGVVHARRTGFDAAHGEIIGRLDGDTVIAPDWVVTAQSLFAGNAHDAVSGTIRYNDTAWSAAFDRVDLFWRRHFAKVLGREVTLQGANMAIRRRVWREVRHELCETAGLHEDFDIAIHANRRNFNVSFEESLVATISVRRGLGSYRQFWQYALVSPRTYARHGLTSQRHMYPLIIFLAVVYQPIKLLHRGYDPYQQRFSLKYLLTGTAQPRVNPATFVD